MKSTIVTLLAGASMVATSMSLASIPASAQTKAEFYKGKQVRLIIGFGAGGAYDLVGQLVARHIGVHLPGDPTIVPVSMPTAGSLNAANYIYNVAPRDGTVFGIVASGAPTMPFFYPDQAKFDAARMTWLGSASKAIFLDVVTSKSAIKTADDIKKHVVFIGATGPGAGAYDLPRLMNAVAGFKYKIVPGYSTVANIYLAMERGEVEGVSGTDWDGIQRAPGYLNGSMRVVVQYGAQKIPQLPNVSLAIDQLTSESQKASMNLMLSREEMGRPFVAPPGVLQARREELRRAFMETMQDPAFLADAAKASISIDPLDGEAVQALVAKVTATPPDVVDHVRDILASK